MPTIAEVHATLTAPGSMFETTETGIRGVPTRTWKNAPPSLRTVIENSRVHGDETFLVYEDERLSFMEHFRAVAHLARVLREEWGVEKGDRVALAMRNYPEWPVAFFAAASAGAIVVPLNSWWTGAELEYGLQDSGAKVLFSDGARAESLVPHLDGLGLERLVVARGGGEGVPGALRFEEVLGTPPADASLPELDLEPEDDATLFYTSGTTGKPKGALGTHRNICSNLVAVAFVQARTAARSQRKPPATRPRNAALISVPFFHATGCHAILVRQPTAAGGQARDDVQVGCRSAPSSSSSASSLTQLRRRSRPWSGRSWSTPRLRSATIVLQRDQRELRRRTRGARARAAHQARPSRDVVSPGNGYGLTETSSITTYNGGDDYLGRPDSVGAPIPVCEVKTVDAEGKTLPPGQVGELWVKGPNVVKGYWGKPEATEETFTRGWLHSGDLGRIDDEGFVYIVDRAKDMVIRGGENVYCVEVESALYEHPAVMDAAVVGIPHKVLGEEVAAVVQVTPASRVGADELRKHVAERLAAFKVPVRIEVRSDPLPRNPNGKIVKRQLRQELLAADANGEGAG